MSTDILFVPAPEFTRVRTLNLGEFERAAIFADLCRLNALSMIAYAGSGHIGSSFSCLDIVTWLYLHELHGTKGAGAGGPDLFFSSKGHDAPGLYAVMIACGLLPPDSLLKLRRLSGLPGHPDVATPNIVTNTGSLGMGISKAKGMAFADRLAGRHRRIFVMTGDGELQEGQIWESLISAANHRLDVITVIVDHNKLQSDVRVDKTSDLGDLEAKFAAFGWLVGRCDGHNFACLSSVLDYLDRSDGRPKVIIADTVKGKGVSFMESTSRESFQTLYRFHSGAPDSETYFRAIDELMGRINATLATIGTEPVVLEGYVRPVRSNPANCDKLVAAYSDALVAQAEKDDRIVALDGDLVLDTGLIPFRDRFPARFFECGIAEQDMVSQAGGMALSGLLPVVHSFACFLAARPTEQIYNNASERTKVIYVGSLAGILPGGPGHSHQAVNDIATLGAIPGLELVEPCCASEVAPLLDYLLHKAAGSGYLRLVSVPSAIPYGLPLDYKPKAGMGVELRQGADAAVIGYGPVLLPQAWLAAEELSRLHGIEIAVINLPWLSQVDQDWLRRVISGRRVVFTLDNHLVNGGQGRMVSAAIAHLGLKTPPRLYCCGLSDFPVCGQNNEVLHAHALDAVSLAQAFLAALALEARTEARGMDERRPEPAAS